jgi:hypothetical protein
VTITFKVMKSGDYSTRTLMFNEDVLEILSDDSKRFTDCAVFCLLIMPLRNDIDA